MTTAGNLVFQTINDGRLVAYSADKGEKLLEIQTGPAQRHGTADHLSARRQAVRGVDGRRRRGRAGGNAGPGNAATPFSPKLLTFVLDGNAAIQPYG